MSFVALIFLVLFTGFCGLVGQGTNKLAAICAVLFLVGSVALYLWPAALAFSRDHPNKVAVAVLNVFLGWTFLGWVIALIWAYKREVTTPALVAAPPVYRPAEPSWARQPETVKLCPFCAEEIKPAAIKCKHCGSDLTAQTA